MIATTALIQLDSLAVSLYTEPEGIYRKHLAAVNRSLDVSASDAVPLRRDMAI